MKNKFKANWGIFVLIIIAVLIDLLIRFFDILHFYVSDDYIGIIFTAICTVASLGSAILSIIIGSLNNKILGFSIKDLVKFSSVDIKNAIIYSLSSIIFAIFLLIFAFINTMTMVLILVVYIITKSSIELWLLVDDDYTKKLITKKIQSGVVDVEFFYSRFFWGLEQALCSNDEVQQDLYIDFINNVNKSSKDSSTVYSSLEKHIRCLFDTACFHLGFVDSYKKVLCLNDWKNNSLIDSSNIALSFIQQIRYCPPYNLGNYKIAATIDDILEHMETEDRIRYGYIYYYYLKENKIIPNEIRIDNINSIINNLCFLRDISRTSDFRGKLLLNIFKDSVLENDNISDRKAFFLIIINNLYRLNKYNTDTCYISVISQMFRALFFYSFFETEILSPEYRKKLSELISIVDESEMNNYKISLPLLFSENADSIISWLVEDATHENSDRYLFDYFPNYSCCKNVIWTQSNLLAFAFYYYAIEGFLLPLFPVKTILENEDFDNDKKIQICNDVLSLFEDSTNLTDQTKNHIEILQNILNNQNTLPEILINENYNYFYEKWSYLNAQQTRTYMSSSSTDIESKNKKLHSLLPDMIKSFLLNTQLDIDTGIKFKIRPVLRRVMESDIGWKVHEVKQILNFYMLRELKTVNIDFSEKGVSTLKKQLETNKYSYRNYTYIDHWAIKEEVRNSDEFKQLSNILDNINYFNNRELQSHIFLTNPQIEYNVKLTSNKFDTPTDKQCEEFVEGCKIADGKYRVDGIVQDFSHAINFVRENYIVESSEYAIITNINKECDFQINLDTSGYLPLPPS